jgi:signal transduction histidine kinase
MSKVQLLEKSLQAEKNDSMKCIYNLRLCAAHLFSNLDTALWYCQQAEKLIKPNSAVYLSAALNKNFGIVYTYRGDYEKALNYNFKAIELYRSIDRQNDVASVLSNIGMLYMDRNENVRARGYYMESLQMKIALQDTYGMMLSSNNVGSTFLNIRQSDSVRIYCLQSLQFANAIDDDYGRSLATSNIAASFLEEEKLDSALKWYIISFDLKFKANDFISLVSVTSEIAQIYEKKKIPALAEKYFDMSLHFADSTGETYYLETALKHAAGFHYGQGNFAKAAQFYNRYVIMDDTLIKKKYDENIAKLETKYGLQNKEYELALQKNINLEQEKKIALNRLFILALGAAILLMVILVWWYVVAQRNKKKAEVNEAIITEQKKSIAAVIQAQDDERRRIGMDLHDGVAQNLVALQLQINRILKKAQSQTDELKDAANLTQLCATEVRNVSHNISPAILEQHGLNDALQNLLKASLQKEISDRRYANKIEINAYRIIQELLNNIIKHAHATLVTLKIKQHNNKLEIELTENGKGWNLKEAIANDSLGIYNIFSRTNYINAEFTAEPQITSGMITKLVIPL